MLSPITPLCEKGIRMQYQQQAIIDCVNLVNSCAASGDLVNPHSIEFFEEKLSFDGSVLLTKYDIPSSAEPSSLVSSPTSSSSADSNLVGCMLLTDKDYCNDGYEYKDFLISELSAHSGIELPDSDTHIMWISAVCTNPESRGSGCASSFFAEADEHALSTTKPYVVIAEAVRETNENMLTFSEHRGFVQLPTSYTESYFGDEDTPGAVPWKILYKFLRLP